MWKQFRIHGGITSHDLYPLMLFLNLLHPWKIRLQEKEIKRKLDNVNRISFFSLDWCPRDTFKIHELNIQSKEFAVWSTKMATRIKSYALYNNVMLTFTFWRWVTVRGQFLKKSGNSFLLMSHSLFCHIGKCMRQTGAPTTWHCLLILDQMLCIGYVAWQQLF